jgi:tetratricopeptide (TPR) repeat protein
VLVGGVLLYRQISAPALTDKDAVVLASVVNRTGDTMFDDTLGEALALQLRQSPFLSVVAEQQVQATLRLMGREPMTPITEEIGREICQRAGAKALLGGTIAMLGSSYVITLDAQDCVEGDVLAEEQAQAASKEEVLNALGSAVSKFREQLGESLASIQRYDSKIEEATTKSLDALKAYSQGMRTRRMAGDFDSVPFFRRAIELDPEFALAYARLGTVYNNLGQNDEAKKMTARAYELRQKTSEAERLYIEARYFTVVEVDTQKALDAYNAWLATYPKEYVALTNSASLHRQNGDVAEAIRKLEMATGAAANEPIGFLNLGSAYLDRRQFADARRAFATSIELRDATNARTGLYTAAVLMGDAALAEQQVAAVRGRRDEADMTAARMFGAAYRGRMKEAAERAVEFQAQMVALSRGPAAGQALIGLAISEALAGLEDTARDRVEAIEAAGVLDGAAADERLVLAAILGDPGEAREVMPILLDEIKKSGRASAQSSSRTRAFQALAALADGKPEDAAALLDPPRFEPGQADIVNIWTLAKARARDFQSAANGFAFLTSNNTRITFNGSHAYFHVMLGRAQTALGQTAEARKSYEAFFDLWKDADPDLPLLTQAREEFAKLGS